ncbi:hypothetical protein ACM66B_002374 [Microbotryomycetes sp. NB124-2]
MSTLKPTLSVALGRTRDDGVNDERPSSSAPRQTHSERFVELEEARKTSSQPVNARTAMLRQEATNDNNRKARSGVKSATSSHPQYRQQKSDAMHEQTIDASSYASIVSRPPPGYGIPNAPDAYAQHQTPTSAPLDQFGIQFDVAAAPFSAQPPTLPPPPLATDGPTAYQNYPQPQPMQVRDQMSWQYPVPPPPGGLEAVSPLSPGSPLHAGATMPLPPFRYTPFQQPLDPVAASFQYTPSGYGGGVLQTERTSATLPGPTGEMADAGHSLARTGNEAQQAPDKPCDVYTCFNPTYCVLNVCGCHLCRNHLGSVIRGARTSFETSLGGEHALQHKVFTCAACHTEAVQAEPVDAHHESEHDQFSNDKHFSVQYLYPSTGYSLTDSLNLDPSLQWPSAALSPGSAAPPPSPLALVPHDATSDMSPLQQWPPFGFMYPFWPIAPNDVQQSTMIPPLGLALPTDAHQFLQNSPFSMPSMAFLPLDPSLFQMGDSNDLGEQALATMTAARLRSGHSRAMSTPTARSAPGQQSSMVTSYRTVEQQEAERQRLGGGVGGATRPTHFRTGNRFGPQHRSVDYGSSRVKYEDESPAEASAVNRSPWPIIKIENIPFDTTQQDLLDWLPPHVFPEIEHVKHPIHIILHRKSGRTLPHCYVEIKSLQLANEIINNLDRKQLGDRRVRVKWERRGELMRDLFSQEGYFAKAAATPAAAPLPPVPTRYVLPQGIIADKDLTLLLEYCQTAVLASKERPPERAFLNIASIVAKFPWSEASLFSLHTRDAVFRCARDACKIASDLGEADESFEPIAGILKAVVKACEGFSKKQKAQLEPLEKPPFFISVESFPALGSQDNKPETLPKQVKQARTLPPPVTVPSPGPVIQSAASLPSSPPLTPMQESVPVDWGSLSPAAATSNKLTTSWSLSDIDMDRSQSLHDARTARSPPQTAPNSPTLISF